MALPHKPPSTGRHWKSGSHSSHMEFQDVVAIWRKQRTGTFVTSPEPELISRSGQTGIGSRMAGNGLSLAPCASMNLYLVISTRMHYSSSALSTQMVLEKVHTAPITQKF